VRAPSAVDDGGNGASGASSADRDGGGAPRPPPPAAPAAARYTLRPVTDELSFEKGFYVFIRALQLLRAHNEGVVVVGLAGPSGSGKTAFSQRVQQFMPGAAVVSMDMVRRCRLFFFPLSSGNDRARLFFIVAGDDNGRDGARFFSGRRERRERGMQPDGSDENADNPSTKTKTKTNKPKTPNNSTTTPPSSSTTTSTTPALPTTTPCCPTCATCDPASPRTCPSTIFARRAASVTGASIHRPPASSCSREFTRCPSASGRCSTCA